MCYRKMGIRKAKRKLLVSWTLDPHLSWHWQADKKKLYIMLWVTSNSLARFQSFQLLVLATCCTDDQVVTLWLVSLSETVCSPATVSHFQIEIYNFALTPKRLLSCVNHINWHFQIPNSPQTLHTCRNPSIHAPIHRQIYIIWIHRIQPTHPPTVCMFAHALIPVYPSTPAIHQPVIHISVNWTLKIFYPIRYEWISYPIVCQWRHP